MPSTIFPYIGEIRMIAANYAPDGWMFCEGQLLPISLYEHLFQLIGTTYGGDGEETFMLPDLRGRVPIHFGTDSFGIGVALGEMGGVEQVTLTTQQIPNHSHAMLATTSAASSTNPSNTIGAASNIFGVGAYGTDTPSINLPANAVTPAGGSQPHNNMQPYVCVNFIIAVEGQFPSQT
jgi:microcystin-dependent protein